MILKVCNECHNAYVEEDNNTKSSNVNRCPCGDNTYFECDEEVYPFLKSLWDKNYETEFSCSGHPFMRNHDATGSILLALDPSAYISIVASSVKIPDFTKYKYGYAHIKYNDPRDFYANEMRRRGVNVTQEYTVTPYECKPGTIFDKYVSEYYPTEKEHLFEWLKGDVKCRYDIRCTKEFYDKVDIPKLDYVLNYLDLLELRHDIAMLISILPYNE